MGDGSEDTVVLTITAWQAADPWILYRQIRMVQVWDESTLHQRHVLLSYARWSTSTGLQMNRWA